MTTLALALDRESGIPLHRQIYDGIRGAILDGRLSPGHRLPSTRGLAVDLAVSRLPVLTAYDQLLHEGYLEGRVGSGTFVSTALPDDLLRPRPAPNVAVQPSKLRRTVPPPRPPLRPRNYGGLGPFRMSLPALDQFPHTTWARLVARHAQTLSPAQMAYSDPAGQVPLRVAIADHLRLARGVRCEAEQVLIVAGSQAALRVSAAVLLKPGERIAVEEPGYPGARSALAASGAELVPVRVDDEGLSVAALRAAGRRVRAAYVTPSHQYPLGMSMTAGRRLELLDWAAKHDAWILEDDYDSEYRYVSRPLGALQGMDQHERVVYIGTFSKVLFPALRIGYLVVPPALWDRFVEARLALDLFSPTLYQLVLAEFLGEGHFARHLRHMRGVYSARRDALLTGLTRHCREWLTLSNADAGLHVAVWLSPGMDDRRLVQQMAARGLAATALSTCYAGAARRSGLLLGFGGSTERRLLEGTRMLAEVLRESAYLP
jgi:GntR family transcriptional regulator / MocR family aminotransferase